MTSLLARAPAPGADTRGVVALIGFQKIGNLGLGYLSAVLRREGFDVRVIDIEQPPDDIVRQVSEAQPLLVGFSLIFQY